MKRTFFIAMPRTGTLALSKMFNTATSIAHHETDDANIVSGAQWKQTNACQTMKLAEKEGKNYICLNQGFGLNLLELYMRDFKDRINSMDIPAIQEEMESLTVGFLFIDPDFALDSFSRLSGGSSPATRQAQSAQLLIQAKMASEMSDRLDKLGVTQFFIDKMGGTKVKDKWFFTEGQLTEMCELVGATTEHITEMQFMPISRTWAELKKVGARLNAALEQKGKGRPSLFNLLDTLKGAPIDTQKDN